jgi:leucyl aminopeptidase
MKWDMGWSAQVIHTMLELDDKNLDVNIIWAVPLAENSVSENAYRPSDIIKSYNWKTVEIINTDAEWRLVLADAISYVSRNYKTSSMYTTATLTWACMHALGFNYTAVMWTDKNKVRDIVALSEKWEEKYLELPLDEYHLEKTKWDISDLKNLSDGVYAGSTMWGAFLVNFVENWEDLTHLDIAWSSDRKDDYSIFVRGWTGVWVDSLSKYFMSLWK